MDLTNREKNREKSGGGEQSHMLKDPTTMLEQEIDQAHEEMDRPAGGLFLSGALAGFGVTISVLLIGILLTLTEGTFPEPVVQLLKANAYSVGFIIVILGHMDLFTEYTTMAILPVLSGDSTVSRLARLWGLVYISNILAAAAFALLIVFLGPALGVIEPHIFGEIAHRLIDHPGGVIMLSAVLAGWIMGLLSWLVSAARETISQIFFVWVITATLGFVGLHHSITGSAEVLTGVFANQGVTWIDFGRFLIWTTLGNIMGGVIFAVMIHYSVIIGSSSKQPSQGLRGSTAQDGNVPRGR